MRGRWQAIGVALGLAFGAAPASGKPPCKPPKKLRHGKCVYVDSQKTHRDEGRRKTHHRRTRVPLGKTERGSFRGKCYGNRTCDGELVCVRRYCRRPGALNEPCREGGACDAGLRCHRKRCEPVPMGDEGGECWGNGTCNGKLTCWEGRCEALSPAEVARRRKARREAERRERARQARKKLADRASRLAKRMRRDATWNGNTGRFFKAYSYAVGSDGDCRITPEVQYEWKQLSGRYRGSWTRWTLRGTVDLSDPSVKLGVREYEDRQVGQTLYVLVIGGAGKAFHKSGRSAGGSPLREESVRDDLENLTISNPERSARDALHRTLSEWRSSCLSGKKSRGR